MWGEDAQGDALSGRRPLEHPELQIYPLQESRRIEHGAKDAGGNRAHPKGRYKYGRYTRSASGYYKAKNVNLKPENTVKDKPNLIASIVRFMGWKDSFEFAYKPGEAGFFLIIACAVTVSHGFLGWPSTDWYLSVWGFWLFSCLDSTHRRLRSIETFISEVRVFRRAMLGNPDKMPGNMTFPKTVLSCNGTVE